MRVSLLSSAVLSATLLAAIAPHANAQVSPQPRFSVPMDDMETIGPFASWANVKLDFGAIGDGVADDTAALQTALDALGKPGKASVLYLPPGTYRITASLRLNGDHDVPGATWGGLSITGEHPGQTTILWDGAQGDPMLIQNGGHNYRYSRITWDGNNKAGYGIAHWWDAKSGILMDSGSEDIDEVFKDMGIGIMGGRLGSNFGQLNSEGQVRRVTFIRNWYAGVDLGSFNALDWWIWDSHFVDCARGVANTFSIDDKGTTSGAGGFHVYRSLFEHSTVADINIANTQWFSMHNNSSFGSRRFFQAEGMGRNPAPIIMQANTIVDTTDSVSIYDGNLGPLMMFDNTILSKSGSTGPAVWMDDWITGRDVLALGNTFTVTSPIKAPAAIDRIIASNSTGVRSQFFPAIPVLPPTPIRQQRYVYEVTAGASASDIQAAINAAATSSYPNPVVHLPPGAYKINQTLIVPARTKLQIAGDALTTTLTWTGPTNLPMFQLQGPSYATLRDMQLLNWAGLAVQISQADQVGGRVFIEGSSTGSVTADSLTQTQLALQANPGIKKLTLSGVKSLASIGSGGMGPVSSANSNVLISDSWYEGSETDLYRITSGNFTFLGGVLAPASHPGYTNTVNPSILLDRFVGRAAFIGTEFDLNGLTSGIGIQIDHESNQTNALFLGATSNKPNYFQRQPTPLGNPTGQVGLVLSKTMGSDGFIAQQPDQGQNALQFIQSSLSQARSLIWETSPYTAPIDATDVRIYRVKADQTNGISVSGQ